ncbi:ABC transporter substrate-binding protein [Candidatus Venteria ishoeyi]|uniref:ABC transporter substrate binding protein n=1 Tax=Candidatus Venteria ishoeyi TaxID=1899563 RepID=A0A1H6F5X5_9GAMM|nr:ABC transporter substrate binding protein [Candidatus Venteria ishoeyi]MDM8545208.1 ABC transporter substrate binding protein [Candidatus Venteria ishoeyi]SEH04689.1 ABC transporter substrate binding protein [Candidatus Venteria ishoeyi]
MFARVAIIITVYLFTCFTPAVYAQNAKKILFINSYHQGYAWSDGIIEGVRSVLDNPTLKTQFKQGLKLEMIEMDTKRNHDEQFRQKAALRVKNKIESFQPDVVIAADDNASRYVIKAYYQDSDLPFVFCGLNWDSSIYGFPYKNVTGMEEVSLLPQVLNHLKTYAKNKKSIGFIAGNAETSRKELKYHHKLFNIQYDKVYFVNSFAQWKEKYLQLQDEVDMLMMLNHAGINDWDIEAAKHFVEKNTQIPSGTMNKWDMPYAMLGITKIAQEQGRWAAHASLKIIQGIKPREIAITQNTEGKLILNMRIVNKLGIHIALPLLRIATFVK